MFNERTIKIVNKHKVVINDKPLPYPVSYVQYFYIAAHFHGSQHIDIRLSKPQQEEALQTHMAIPHQYAPQAGWVSCIIETKEQANNTKRLLKQAYDTCVSLRTSRKS